MKSSLIAGMAFAEGGMMRVTRKSIIILALGTIMAGWSALLSDSTAAHASEVTITVSSYIDGEDYLYIQGDTLQWETISDTPVGDPRFDVPSTTTDVSTTLNGNPVQSFDWQPVYQPSSNFTYVYTGLSPSLPSTPTSVSLAVLEGRESLTILQQPSALNGETLILDFNDGGPNPDFNGAAVYTAQLTFNSLSSAPLPSTWTMLIAGFVGLFGFLAFGGKKRNAAAAAAG
jgi:hypothetical protein